MNVNSEDEQTRYEALTYLIRTFTGGEYGELNNAFGSNRFSQSAKTVKI